jgi:phage terminase large subunit-like protein
LLPPVQRAKIIETLSEEEAESLLKTWEFWARPSQLPPDGDWYVWLMTAGRGFGKTRAGAELVTKWVREGFSPIALLGQTKADVRDTMVDTGESSLLKISPPGFQAVYEASHRRVRWPNGAIAIMYYGDEPDQLRGPQHQKAWVDELAKFKYPQEAWDNLMLGLRIGSRPQAVVTTTPRPIKTLKTLLADSRTVVTRGHTLENKANVAPDFLRYVLGRYEGTRLGRQELAGEFLDDNPNALWQRKTIDELRVRSAPDLSRIVIGVDPEVESTEGSAETGIIAAGITNVGGVLHGYVLDDLSLRASPSVWATAAVTGYHKFSADKIVAEVNQGGDMVESTIHTVEANVGVEKVRASRGKYVRAEPISALYEQGRIHHVGFFSELEDQMCEWIPGATSPDRLDALVWALTELFDAGEPAEITAPKLERKPEFAGVRGRTF